MEFTWKCVRNPKKSGEFPREFIQISTRFFSWFLQGIPPGVSKGIQPRILTNSFTTISSGTSPWFPPTIRNSSRKPTISSRNYSSYSEFLQPSFHELLQKYQQQLFMNSPRISTTLSKISTMNPSKSSTKNSFNSSRTFTRNFCRSSNKNSPELQEKFLEDRQKEILKFLVQIGEIPEGSPWGIFGGTPEVLEDPLEELQEKSLDELQEDFQEELKEKFL